MHGNEVVSREVLLALIAYLCQGYREQDPEVVWLMDNTRIHIMPSMNPDGWEFANSRPRKVRKVLNNLYENKCTNCNKCTGFTC